MLQRSGLRRSLHLYRDPWRPKERNCYQREPARWLQWGGPADANTAGTAAAAATAAVRSCRNTASTTRSGATTI